MTAQGARGDRVRGAGGRTGRRGRWSRVLGVALAFVVAAAACGGDGASTSAPSRTTSATDVGPDSAAPATSARSVVVDPELVGSWGAGASDGRASLGYLELEANGQARWRGFDTRTQPWDAIVVKLDVACDDDTLLVGGDGPWGCEGTSGRYTWSVVDDALRLRSDDEPCASRAGELILADSSDGPAWHRLDPVPVVDAGLVDEPVAVESPFGRIEWVQLDAPADLDELIAVDGGFLAVASDRSDVSRLVASPDGRSWEELGVRWSTPRRLIESGGRVSAIGDGGPDGDPRAPAVSVSVDGGRSWESVVVPSLPDDVEATEVSVASASAGRAGLIISAAVDRESSQWTPGRLWVSDGATFEVIETPFTDLGQAWTRPWVWALDTGFLAAASSDLSGLALWRSSDGRTWEEIDLAADTFLFAVDGDTVVLTSAAGDGNLVSRDGGVTWEDDPTVQPVGPGDHFVAFDRGYLAVEVALFGPWVGVVWASSDGSSWERVLNPWPPPLLSEPVISDDVIVMLAERDADDRVGQGIWVGTLLDRADGQDAEG